MKYVILPYLVTGMGWFAGKLLKEHPYISLFLAYLGGVMIGFWIGINFGG